METVREKALEIALSYEGKEEIPRGSNAGAFVIACLAMVGLDAPNSWCMAYVFRCFREAATALGLACPVNRTAGVMDCWNKSTPSSRILKADARPTNILPGYQFIYDHGKGLGHTGIVVEVLADGSFITIEGNTDPAGSRNGYGVFKRTRHFTDAQLKGFITY